MSEGISARNLLIRDLKDFRVIEMTEVYRVDDDGHKSKSIGFFKSPEIAEIFARGQRDADWHKTQRALVLTDGEVGFVIEQQNSIVLLDDKTQKKELRAQLLSRFTPAERAIVEAGD